MKSNKKKSVTQGCVSLTRDGSWYSCPVMNEHASVHSIKDEELKKIARCVETSSVCSRTSSKSTEDANKLAISWFSPRIVRKNFSVSSPVSSRNSASPSLTGTDCESTTPPLPLLDDLGMMEEEPDSSSVLSVNKARHSVSTRNSLPKNEFSWFDEQAIPSLGSNDWEEEIATEDLAFHRKLQRAQDKANKSPRKKKVSAKEAYTAGFDYGHKEYGRYGSSNTSIRSSTSNPRSKSRTSSVGSANSISACEQELDNESQASTSSCHVGIGPPEPLEKDFSGSREFLLPTVIVSSGMWTKSKSSFSNHFQESLVSPFSTPQSVSRDRIRSLGDAILDLPALSHETCMYPSDSSLGSNSISKTSEKSCFSSEIERRNNTLLLEDPSLSRVFILLLEPIKRKFELIQILCHLSAASVGDLLKAIPSNTTVSFMANQQYRGFCRPKDGIEMTEECISIGKVPGGWRVIRGEILIAIPVGYTGSECKLMSEPILHNLKLVNLLKRKDPLAPLKKKDRSNHRSRRESSDSRYTPLARGQFGLSDEDNLSCSSFGSQSGKHRGSLLSVNENEIVTDHLLAHDLEPNSALMALQRLAQASAICTGVSSLIDNSTTSTHRKARIVALKKKLTAKSPQPDYGPLKQVNEQVQVESEVKMIRQFADNACVLANNALERVAEEIDEDSTDDDVTIASEAWEHRLRRAHHGNGHLCNDVVEILADELKACDLRFANTISQDDSYLLTCLGIFFGILVLRMVFKVATGIEVSPSPMGGQGVIFCAAILKSLVHLQRVWEANNKITKSV